jgi:uncharacterized protein
MKQLLLSIFVLGIISTCFGQEPVRKIDKPVGGLINDAAGILNADEERLLNEQLIQLDNSTSNQIGIATIRSLEGGSLEDVAVETYRSWGLGTAKNNNGVLILVVSGDKRVRIEVGYGLEGAIPDAVSGSIIRNDMTPLFKQGDYYHGIQNAVDNLSKAAAGEYSIPRERSTGSGTGGSSIFKFILIAIFIIIFIGRSGGRGGGRGGRVMSRRGSDWIGPMILGSMLGGGRSGGGFGGGGFGGGGGGFGGFGGGMSGGGGASGSW